MEIVLNILMLSFAFVAAVFWFISASVKIPKSFRVHVVQPHEPPLGDDPLDGTFLGLSYSNDLIDLTNQLAKQSKYSAIGAGLAGLSASIQVWLYFI